MMEGWLVGGREDGWLCGWIDGWTDGRMGKGRTDGWNGRQMDEEPILIHHYFTFLILVSFFCYLLFLSFSLVTLKSASLALWW